MVTDEVKQYFLEHGRVATIATPRRNAGPNMSPLWFYWDPDEQVFLISTYDTAAKVRTLRRSPAMSLLIDDPVNNLGVYVLVYGRGEIIGPGEAAVEPSLRLIKKYRYTDAASLQHWKEINEDGQRVVIRMTPDEWHWRNV
jgi:PPOX class probable F420-dependent enzyme